MLSGSWKEHWPWYLFFLSCLGAVLPLIMILSGVPANSPWFLIPLIIAIPLWSLGFLLVLFHGLALCGVFFEGLAVCGDAIRSLTRVFSTSPAGPSESILLTVVHVVCVFLRKILPRLLLIAAVFVIAYLLRDKKVYFVIPLGISLFLIHRFPPSIETLYILKKTGDKKQDNSNFKSLLKESKDKDSGEYRVGESVAVKSYSRPILLRYWSEFSSKHNPDEYEVFLHSKTKSGYNDHYHMFAYNRNDGEKKGARIFLHGRTTENKTLFPIKDIVELRQCAQEADNPLTLLAQFSSLSLKEGFSLCTLESFVGYVWAIPISSSPPELENCEMVDLWNLPRPFPIDNSCLDAFSEPGSKDWPKPRNALNNVMDAIQGDGTPVSYMQASIFAREAAEFRPLWHGDVWSTHTILGADPWTCPQDWGKYEIGPASQKDWKWLDRKPSEWSPSVVWDGEVITVKFYTFSGLVQQAIYCYTDTYKINNYKFEYNVKIVAEGPEGFIF